MNLFYNLRTMTKLLVSFAMMSVVMAVVGYFGVSGMIRINDMLNSLYSRDLTGLNAVMQSQIERLAMARDVRDIVIATDPAAQERASRSLEEHETKFRAFLDDTEKLLVTDEGRRRMVEIRQNYGPLVSEM